MKTKLPSKKSREKESRLTSEHSSSSSKHVSALGSQLFEAFKSSMSEVQLLAELRDGLTRMGQRTVRRVLNKDEVIVYELPLVPKTENLDGNQVATDELWYSADFLSGCWCFSWFPWPVCPPPGFLCFFVDVAPNPRILCIGIWEFSTACSRESDLMFFFSVF